MFKVLHVIFVSPTLQVSDGWLAYVLFHAYQLYACEQKYLRKQAHLSSWCLRYCLMKWSSLLMFKCLENLFENLETPLQSSSLICKVLPKQYDEISWKSYTHMLLIVVALSFVKLLWPREKFLWCYHDQDSRAHHIPLARLIW